MPNTVRVFIIAVFLSVSSFAATLPPFGAPFPLTNTRYGATSGAPLLRTNGHDAFVFWLDDRLRVRRVVAGEKEVGRPIFDIPVSDGFTRFDVVWIGDHFLAAIDDQKGILGRIIDANGVPAGTPFTIANGAFWHMASNGNYVLMLMMGTDQALVLTPDGRQAGFPRQLVPRFSSTAPVVTSNGTGFAALFATGLGQELLTFDARGQIASDRMLTGDFGGVWSIASDGNRYLAVSSSFNSVDAYLVNSDGSSAATLAIDQSPGGAASLFFKDPTAVWTGSDWALAYDADGQTPAVRLAHLDAGAQSIVSREALPFQEDWALAALGGHLIGTWTDTGTILSGQLPFTAGAESVAFAATRQEVQAVASSADATLTVWREIEDDHATTRAGIRTRDGLWREGEIGAASATAIAASDGQQFVVVLGNTAIFLDHNAQPIHGAVIAAFQPAGIAWNGQSYGLTGIISGTPVGALLSPDGSVSDTRIIKAPQQAAAPSIASDGTGFFATWFVTTPCGPVDDFCTPTTGLAGIHLDAQLHAIDATPTVFVTNDRVVPGRLAWNGSRYVVVWSSLTRGVMAASVGASGPPELRVLNPSVGGSISVSAINGGVAIGWGDLITPTDYLVSILLDNGQSAGPAVIHQEPSGVSWFAELTSLADGELTFIYSSPQSQAPQHGTAHVMMAVGTLGLPQRASAPLLTVVKQTGAALLSWTAPPQPVAGYRVEYRIGDGLWTEVDTWLDAGQRTFSFPLSSPASAYTFRVRAWNDAGTGDYSISDSGRRRAVR
ncbi:MAG TPA: fibronectin type III domain-containing protein [Thermoanaerobaculia bacterium]|jgi:hypothetical protein|nr:fibronectin type III domain-containing protein [Thermoanaerobaculia bacterium]